VTTARRVEDLLRDLAPQVLGALVRRHGHFAESEEAVQEALLAGAAQWQRGDLPDDPRAWLITVASRRLVDQLRSDQARRRREEADYALTAADGRIGAAADAERTEPEDDDTLKLLALCCHQALAPASQVALTLRAVGGLTTAEIAVAYLVPEATMAQRISRAKRTIDRAGRDFGDAAVLDDARRRSVLHVLYLIFNEGYVVASGERLHRADLTHEAIRLTRRVRDQLPHDGEVDGLLALMLLTDARRPARTGPGGELVPLDEQDRGLWDRGLIDEGVALVTDALANRRLGPYQLQAAIAAVHAEAPAAADTDWEQILALYELLVRMTENPVFRLNRAVAIGMTRGPSAGLQALDALAADERLATHRLPALRGHLLEMAGDRSGARAEYLRAARRTRSTPERRYLEARAARL
jgi:RNA polymerase sigma factor (sigma-70 family)